jgi:hypothetical protein
MTDVGESNTIATTKQPAITASAASAISAFFVVSLVLARA